MKSKLSAHKLFRAGLLAFVLVIMVCTSAAFAEAFAGGGIDFAGLKGYITPSSVTVYCIDAEGGGADHGAINVDPHHPAEDAGNGVWTLTIKPDEWAYYVSAYNEAKKIENPDGYIEHFVDEANLPTEDVVITYTHNCGVSSTGVKGTLTKAASCTEDGLVTIECFECLRTWTEVIPAGHSKTESNSTGKYLTPTCSAPGWTEYHCRKCGQDFREEIPINPYNHSKVLNEETSLKPTCTEYGYKSYDCELCGKKNVSSVNDYPTHHNNGELLTQHHHHYGNTKPYELFCPVCDKYVNYYDIDARARGKCPACDDPACTDPQYVTDGIPEVKDETGSDDGTGDEANSTVTENEPTAAGAEETQVQVSSLPEPPVARMTNTRVVACAAARSTTDAVVARSTTGDDDIHQSDAPFGVRRDFSKLGNTIVEYWLGGELNNQDIEGNEWIKPIETEGRYRASWGGDGGELKLPVKICTYQVEWINADTDEVIKSAGRSDVSRGETAQVREADKTLKGYTYLPGHEGEVLSGTVTEDSMLVLKLYFKSGDATPSYIVHWVDQDGRDLTEPELRDGVEVGEEVSVTDADKERTFPGYEFDSSKAGEWTKLVAAEGKTELFIYYAKTGGTTPENPPVIPETPPTTPDDPGEDIPEPDVPLSDIPEEDPPLEDIPEEDPPLSGVPETGDISQLWAMLALLTGAGLVWMVLDSKKHRKDA